MRVKKRAIQQRPKKSAALPPEISVEKASEKERCKRVEERIAKLNCLKEKLAAKRNLNENLNLITDGAVEIFGADFARVWIIKEGDLCTQGCRHVRITERPEVCQDQACCLHLMASSGRYTLMEGRHHRLPLRGDKIGSVASGEDFKLIINDAIHDPRIHDHGWARRIGLVSFAGYRLFSGEGKPGGVLALFSKRAIVPDEEILLENLSYITSQIIQSEIAEAARRRSEERFRLISESLPVGVFEMDHAGSYIYTNKKWQDLFNVALTESFSVHWNQLCHAEDRENVRKEWSAAMRNLSGFSKEFRIHTPEGAVRWIHFRSSPIMSDRGVRYTGTVEDITDRKQTEEAQRRSEHEAKRVAMENATMAEIGRILNSTLNLQDVYERFAEEVRKLIPFDRIGINAKKSGEDTVTGIYQAGLEVPGRQTGKGFPLAGTVTEEVLRTRSSLLFSANDLEGFLKRFPGNLPLYQGGLRSLMGIPLFSRDELVGVLIISSVKGNAYTEEDLRLSEKIGTQVAGAIANAQLYSELKRTEEDLRHTQAILETRVKERTEDFMKARDVAEAANRAKSDFLANMSHELRTPLNHIIGFTELIVDKQCGELNKEQDEYLNDVLQSGRHLLSLINDILDLSKVEAGKLELQVQEVYLQKLLEGSLSMVKEKAMKHRIRLLTDIEGIPEEIQADERKLKQIIFNLLSNSVKFTPDGGSVTLSARYLSFRGGHWRTRDGEPVVLPSNGDDRLTKGGLIDISVQDTGIGIRWENLERIFDPFEQGDNSNSHRYQGTGLGLSLSRKLVELHGGRIWAVSEGEGKGSKFTFVIPYYAGTDAHGAGELCGRTGR